MQPVERLLARLDGVRQTGAGRWLARCPAHEDGRASLSVRELDDGRVLLHCFAACAAADVLAAVSLSLTDLYPRGPLGEHARGRRLWSARDVLRAIAYESSIVTLAASALARGETLSDGRRSRLLLAVERMQHAVELVDA